MKGICGARDLSLWLFELVACLFVCFVIRTEVLVFLYIFFHLWLLFV